MIRGLSLFAGFLATAAADGPDRILIVHSFGRDYSPYAEVASAFRAGLARLAPGPLEFLDASLEMARFDGENRDAPLADYLRAVYRRDPPDLVVPIGAPAAQFCVRRRDDLFPGSPILVLYVDRRRFDGLIEGRDIAVVGLDLDVTSFVENILRLQPETKHVYLVMGTAPLEHYWEETLLREWEVFADRLRFHSLSARPVAAMRETVSRLPSDAVIVMGIVNLDANGIPYVREQALRSLREVANRPIYGVISAQLGHGIVGGPLAPGMRVGQPGAEAAMQILEGVPADGLRPQTFANSAPAYDWRELKRWRIPEDRLPPGSRILFRPGGFWESHRSVIIGASAIIVLQSFLIAGILRTRRRARESDAGLTVAADAAKVGLWEHHPKLGQITATGRWRKIFGLPMRGSLSIGEVLRRVHPDDRPALLDAIEAASETGRGFSIEHRVLLPDGTSRWISSHGRAEVEGAGPGIRGASIDITERYETEATVARQRQELAHLSRISSLGVLAGALAHEINQPLGIILSNAQAARHLLASDPADLRELRQIIEEIVAEDRRASEVITRLRSLLRRGESSPRPLDLNTCVGDVLPLVRPDLLRKEIQLETELQETLPNVMADRIQLQQVLINLIVNASDVVLERPVGQRRVTVRTESEDNEVRMAVFDTGSGLPEDTEILFQPFRTSKEEGLGMGLTICRTIVEAHAGRLWAEDRPGGGAVFTVALPARSTDGS